MCRRCFLLPLNLTECVYVRFYFVVGQCILFYANSMIESLFTKTKIYDMFILNVTIIHLFCIRNSVSNAIDNGDITVSTTIFKTIIIYFVEFIWLRCFSCDIKYPTENRSMMSNRIFKQKIIQYHSIYVYECISLVECDHFIVTFV